MLFEDQVTTRSYYLVYHWLLVFTGFSGIAIPIILHEPFYFELNCILASSNIVSSDIITFTGTHLSWHSQLMKSTTN